MATFFKRTILCYLCFNGIKNFYRRRWNINSIKNVSTENNGIPVSFSLSPQNVLSLHTLRAKMRGKKCFALLKNKLNKNIYWSYLANIQNGKDFKNYSRSFFNELRIIIWGKVVFKYLSFSLSLSRKFHYQIDNNLYSKEEEE